MKGGLLLWLLCWSRFSLIGSSVLPNRAVVFGTGSFSTTLLLGERREGKKKMTSICVWLTYLLVRIYCLLLLKWRYIMIFFIRQYFWPGILVARRRKRDEWSVNEVESRSVKIEHNGTAKNNSFLLLERNERALQGDVLCQGGRCRRATHL